MVSRVALARPRVRRRDYDDPASFEPELVKPLVELLDPNPNIFSNGGRWIAEGRRTRNLDMSAELPVHESREAVFLKLPHPTLVAHAYDQRRRGDVRLRGVAFIHAHGIVFLSLFVACLSLCERLAGLWLRPCYVSSLPSHVPLSALPRCVVAGNLCAFTVPISCLALAQASWCPLVLGRS